MQAAHILRDPNGGRIAAEAITVSTAGILPAMRRFIFALLRKAGEEPRGGSGKGVVIINVPARPFLRPAFKKFSQGSQARFLARVAALSGLGGR